MREENGMIAALRKRPNLPGIIVSIVIVYLVAAWITFYLVDVNNFLGLRSLLISTGALKPPVVWYHLFREGGLTEIMQWSLLAGTAYYSRLLGKEFRASGNKKAASFWFLLSLAAFFMFLEDAVNVRHALSFLARLLFYGYHPQLIRTIAETIYFVALGSIPLYALFRYGQTVWGDKGTRRFLLAGFTAYAIAVGASVSRFVADWYNAAGHFIHNAVGRGSLLLPAGWQVADLEFFLMDWIVEESIEIVGAAALFAATLTYFSKLTGMAEPQDDISPHNRSVSSPPL